MNTLLYKAWAPLTKFPALIDTLSFLTGLLFIFSFAPFHWWGLGIFSLAVLTFILLYTDGLLRAFWRGLLFGLGLYGVGLHWFFQVSHSVSADFAPVIRLILLLTFSLLALYPALASVVLVSIKKRLSAYWMLAALPFVWTFFEWLRSWVLTGLPLYQPAYAFIDTPLAGFAPVGGELLVTLTVMLSVSCVGLVIYSRSYKVKAACMTLMAFIWLIGLMLSNHSWIEKSGQELVVRLVHGTPDTSKKFKRYYAVDTIKKYLEYSSAFPKADLVIWPESSVAYGFHDVKRYLLPKARKLASGGTHILLGSYIETTLGSFNSFLSASKPRVRYDKQHLIPFGEFTPEIPFVELKEYLPDLEKDALTPGSLKQKTLTVNNITIAPAICYEVLFGNEFWDKWKGADLLVAISDLSWFKNTWGIDQPHQITRFRSLESAKPVLTSTSYGITAVIDSNGSLIAQNTDLEGYFDSKVHLTKGKTPFAIAGNLPVLGMIFGMFVAIGVLSLKKAY